MSLLDQINADFLEAYKSKEEMKVSVLRMIKSAIKNYEIAEKTSASDDDVQKVLKRELKQRKESLLEFEKAGRNDLSDKEKNEIIIIESYLPAQLSEEETKKLVLEAIATTGASEMKDMGKVISYVISQAGQAADGALVSKIARELLS